jgi:cobalt-precorrin-7 (C5)-methyltransferase
LAEEKSIVIVGCGPGGEACLTAGARRAVAGADVLVGAGRLLELFPDHPGERLPLGADIEKVLEEIAGRLSRGKVAVLVTGDPGLCSLARPVLRRFGRESCTVIPGISSLQVAFARLGLDWMDARIVDAHGREPDIDPVLLARESKIAVLAGRPEALRWIAGFIKGAGVRYAIYVCEDLTLAGEKVREVKERDLETLEISSRSIVLLIKAGVGKERGSP